MFAEIRDTLIRCRATLLGDLAGVVILAAMTVGVLTLPAAV